VPVRWEGFRKKKSGVGNEDPKIRSNNGGFLKGPFESQEVGLIYGHLSPRDKKKNQQGN